MQQIVAAYATDLSAFPLWAIEAACLIMINTPKEFPASSPMLRARVLAECEPVRVEIADIERVLNAAVYREPTEEERERISAGFDRILADLKISQAIEPKRERAPAETTRQEADSKLAHLAAVATKPLTISPGLAQKLEAEKHRTAAAAE